MQPYQYIYASHKTFHTLAEAHDIHVFSVNRSTSSLSRGRIIKWAASCGCMHPFVQVTFKRRHEVCL